MKEQRKGTKDRWLLGGILSCMILVIGIGYGGWRYWFAKGAPAEMVRIPAGEFIMGYDEEDSEFPNYSDPAHPVTVKAFDLDKTEVTVEAYERCVRAGKCSAAVAQYGSERCNSGKDDKLDHPLNCVNWAQAIAYCAWVDCRLPSEAEWEYASRGGHDDWYYPWGNEDPDCTRAVMGADYEGQEMPDEISGCGKRGTWPVCSKGEFGFGLCDMAGNVSEWVQDRWHERYFHAPEDGSPWMEMPQVASNGVKQADNVGVSRGGHWHSVPFTLNTYYRQRSPTDWSTAQIGFRCARDAQEVQ